jgi:hypothetical protein
MGAEGLAALAVKATRGRIHEDDRGPARQVDEFGRQVKDDKGKPIWIKRRTPAMEAGVATEIWIAERLLKLTDSFQRERVLARREAKKAKTAALKALAKRTVSDAVRAAYWVYHSAVHHTAKVHAAHCANCRDGMGKSGKGATKSGRWLPFNLMGADSGLIPPSIPI